LVRHAPQCLNGSAAPVCSVTVNSLGIHVVSPEEERKGSQKRKVFESME